MSKFVYDVDPTDGIPATLDDLKLSMNKILQMPVEDSVGDVYQYSTVDEDKMRKAAKGLSKGNNTIPWRKLNNEEIELTSIELTDLMEDLDERQFIRGVVVDSEYMAMKTAGGYTTKQLADWESKYRYGYIPTT